MPAKGWKKNTAGVFEPPTGAVEICLGCWPDGWPPNSGDAECVHGHWHREAADAAQDEADE